MHLCLSAHVHTVHTRISGVRVGAAHVHPARAVLLERERERESSVYSVYGLHVHVYSLESVHMSVHTSGSVHIGVACTTSALQALAAAA